MVPEGEAKQALHKSIGYIVLKQKDKEDQTNQNDHSVNTVLMAADQLNRAIPQLRFPDEVYDLAMVSENSAVNHGTTNTCSYSSVLCVCVTAEPRSGNDCTS